MKPDSRLTTPNRPSDDNNKAPILAFGNVVEMFEDMTDILADIAHSLQIVQLYYREKGKSESLFEPGDLEEIDSQQDEDDEKSARAD